MPPKSSGGRAHRARRSSPKRLKRRSAPSMRAAPDDRPTPPDGPTAREVLERTGPADLARTRYLYAIESAWLDTGDPELSGVLLRAIHDRVFVRHIDDGAEPALSPGGAAIFERVRESAAAHGLLPYQAVEATRRGIPLEHVAKFWRVVNIEEWGRSGAVRQDPWGMHHTQPQDRRFVLVDGTIATAEGLARTSSPTSAMTRAPRDGAALEDGRAHGSDPTPDAVVQIARELLQAPRGVLEDIVKTCPREQDTCLITKASPDGGRTARRHINGDGVLTKKELVARTEKGFVYPTPLGRAVIALINAGA